MYHSIHLSLLWFIERENQTSTVIAFVLALSVGMFVSAIISGNRTKSATITTGLISVFLIALLVNATLQFGAQNPPAEYGWLDVTVFAVVLLLATAITGLLGGLVMHLSTRGIAKDFAKLNAALKKSGASAVMVGSHAYEEHYSCDNTYEEDE